MESTQLLVGGGGVFPPGDPVTSLTGVPRDYGGAQQLNTTTQRQDASGTYTVTQKTPHGLDVSNSNIVKY